jgi:hypothetical protein
MSLSPELMGLLSLAVLWTATLLILAVAIGDGRGLSRRRAQLRPLDPAAVGTEPVIGLLHGRAEAEGLAEHIREETGRSLPRAKVPTILLHPRQLISEIHGGRIDLGSGQTLELAAVTSSEAEVWREDGAAEPSDVDFEAALAEAKKSKGWRRRSVMRLEQGQELWILAEVKRRPDGVLEAKPTPDLSDPARHPRLLLAPFDPRIWLQKKTLFVWAVSLAILISAAAVTAIALIPPAFGLVSTLGGVLGLAYFLAVQPIGVWLRDQVSSPARQVVHRSWRGQRSGSTA